MLANTSESDITKALQQINLSQSIAIIPHRSPDGDAIGSALAVKFAVQSINKSAETVCIDPPPKNTKFLPGIDQFIQTLNAEKYDLIIFVDCGATYMTKFHETHPEIFQKNCINIDHHESNEFYGKINIVEPKCASTTQILYLLFRKWGIKIDPKIATCLLTGLYFDTGSFRHTNTTSAVLGIASELTKLGANLSEISKNLFRVNTIPQLRLWGQIFNNTKRTSREIITSTVSSKDLEDLKSNPKDTEGAIDFLNAIPESKFCLLIAEDQKGGVKGSFRTQSSQIDLSRIAELFGGGGHKMASGFRITAKIAEKKHWEIN